MVAVLQRALDVGRLVWLDVGQLRPVGDRHDRSYERPLAASAPDLELAACLYDPLAHAEQAQVLAWALARRRAGAIEPLSLILHLQHDGAPVSFEPVRLAISAPADLFALLEAGALAAPAGGAEPPELAAD